MSLEPFPVEPVGQSRLSQVDFDNLGFGSIFSDHMFSMDYQDGAWRMPRIHPYGALSLEPGVAMSTGAYLPRIASIRS